MKFLTKNLILMKTTSFFTGLLVLAVLASSCTKDDHEIYPTAAVTSATMTVNSFDHLDVSDAFAVYVTFADAPETVTIEANSNLHPYIIVEDRDDRLRIKLDDRINIKSGNAVLNVYITAPEIERFTARGAVYMELMNPLYDNDVDIHLDGASVFRGVLHASKVDAELHGASVMFADGTAANFRFDASGASHMEGFGFMTDELKADLSGASNMELTVHRELRVTASGASSVIYRGDGIVTSMNLSGASTVVRVN